MARVDAARLWAERESVAVMNASARLQPAFAEPAALPLPARTSVPSLSFEGHDYPIDFTATADFYPGRVGHRSRQITYRRFDNAAEAIRFAIEDMPVALLRSSLMEVDEQRFEGGQIRQLYDSAAFPIPRRTTI